MLPPHELKNKEFQKVLRGYSPEEVNEHIDFIIQKYTELYREQDELSRKLRTTEAKLQQLQKEEEGIRTALINAQRAGSRVIRDANRQAELIVKSAKENCDKILSDFRVQLKEERDTLYRLRKEVAKFKADTFAQYSTHIAYLESIAPDRDDSAEWDVSDREYWRRAIRSVKEDVAQAMEEEKNAIDEPIAAAPIPQQPAPDEPITRMPLPQEPAEATAIPTMAPAEEAVVTEAVSELPLERASLAQSAPMPEQNKDIKNTILELNRLLEGSEPRIDPDDPLKALTGELELPDGM